MIEEIRAIIEKHLDDNWFETPISFENVYFSPVPGQSWIEIIHIMPSTGEQISLGQSGAVNRWTGEIVLAVNTPVGQGSAEANKYADQLIGLFYHFQQAGLTLRTGHAVPIGEMGHWYIVNVNIPFQYDKQL